MNKRLSFFATALLLLVFILSACSGTQKQEEPVTIRMLLGFPAVAGDVDPLYQEAADNFKKLNPAITVVFDQVQGNTFGGRDITDRLNSNEPPDIIPFAPKDDIMVDLLNIPGSKEIDMEQELLEAVKVNGELQILPYAFDTNVVLYNKELFDKANIPYPQGEWTWEQFRDLSKKLNASGDPVLPYDFSTLRLLLASRGVDVISPAQDSYTGYLDSPEAIRTIEWLNAFYKDSNENPVPMSYLNVWENFASLRRTAFFVGTYNSLLAGRRFGVNFEVAPLPYFEDGSRANQVSISGYGIVKTSEHREEALRFLEYLFLTQNEVTSKLANSFLSPSKSMSEANGQNADPVKQVFIDELKYARGVNTGSPLSEEETSMFNSLLTSKDEEIGYKLHQLAEVLDVELIQERANASAESGE